MSKIEFISHEEFTEDEYTKEIVYLCLEGKYRIGFARKKAKNGGVFWTPATLGVMKGGKKEYFQGFIPDSKFLEIDIREFLEKRKWEKHAAPQFVSTDSTHESDYIPF